MRHNLLQTIDKKLKEFRETGDVVHLQTLFRELLNWGKPKNTVTIPIPTPNSSPIEAVPIAELKGLPVYLIQWPENQLPNITSRRRAQKELSKYHVSSIVCCYVTRDNLSTPNAIAFTWAKPINSGKTQLRTLPYSFDSHARTTIERLAELAFELESLNQLTINDVQSKVEHAFDVEAVTKQFFDDYNHVFNELQKILISSHPSTIQNPTEIKVFAHDYALQLLNRIMFLYFIQRKRWLGGDPNFIAKFWCAYRESGQPKDTFFKQWLSVLFFEAFNKKFQAGRSDRSHLPPNVRSALAQAPYLNGGLFTPNRLDEAALELNLPDDFFALLFDQFNGTTPGFLERYNFTIAESTPLDIEVAVNPEMIGKVYESLVNVTSEGLTEEDLRGTAGIFYTPRVEIDLMCRLSLVDALANRLGTEHKPLLYDAVFASDPAEKEASDQALAERNLWPKLNECLRNLTICDPACGSGSFLVGMLLVLDDLQARANTQLGIDETPYERRRRIIGEQLYGVDVMDWAVHIAELRLWLQLVVETDLHPAELHLRPLLPNLSFKIRQGDSLVQEIGSVNFGLHRHHLDIPPHLKGRLTQLKAKKLRFYQGEPGLRESDLKLEERNLFRDILEHKRFALLSEIKKLTQQIESPSEQRELSIIDPAVLNKQRLALEAQWRAELEEKQADLRRVEQALDGLRTAPTVPFVWDIAFVEIFEGEAGGFDIVIGNPPYVRQEMIAPPLLDPDDFGGENSDRWKEQKKAYKEKLQRSVAAAWPRFFRYKPGSNSFRKLDGKSDLYIYFYLHGLALLNPHGSFCFITSNSWLDVGYGADLQEFLLKHSHVKLILDNEKKRSFAQADVNTIIALLAPPDDHRESGLDKTARFVMFKVPFEEVLRADVFKQIEAAGERRATAEWRICVCPQRQLLEEGLDTGDADDGGTASTPSIGGTRSTASTGGTPSTASLGPGGTGPSTPIGGTASTPSIPQIGGTRSTASLSGRGGTRPSNQFGMIHIKTARYIGNKWGGKYLRAPDIFFTILKKGKGKLVRLGDIAEVRRGFTTGANEFFYLEPTGKPAPKGYLHVRNAAGWEGEIEEEFLKPVISSMQDISRLIVRREDVRTLLFSCPLTLEELKRQRCNATLSYVAWGAQQRTRSKGKHTIGGVPLPKAPTVKNHTPAWFCVTPHEPGSFIVPRLIRERFFFADNPDGISETDMFFHGYVKEQPRAVSALLNCTFSYLLLEIIGRQGIEGRFNIYSPELAQVVILDPSLLGDGGVRTLVKSFEVLGSRPVQKILDEIHQPDRRALDDVVFDVLGLTAGEREAVYEAVVELVRARLEKARSV